MQTVYKETNKKYYDLINEFYKLTNVPIVLNTSFNENEPIVSSPAGSSEIVFLGLKWIPWLWKIILLKELKFNL